MKGTTTLRCAAWRVIDALTVDRSQWKRRELTVKSSGRNLNRLQCLAEKSDDLTF
jgi:hypothetical protein